MIITVTLNPAIDRILVIDELKLNSNNRIKQSFECLGGKGTHVSVNLALLDLKSRALGIAMGENGQRIIRLLESINVDVKFLYYNFGNSRTNYVVVDKFANSTLISEKGHVLNSSQIEEFICHFQNNVFKDDIVVISGDVSNQGGSDLFYTLIEICEKKGAKLCLDVSGNQLSCAIQRRPFLIKPNIDELEELYKTEIKSIKDVIDYSIDLYKKGILNVFISCGKDGFVANIKGCVYHVIPPEIKPINTVGCGDALLSGILFGLENNLDMENMLRYSSGISAAKAMNIKTAGFDIELAKRLSQDVVLIRY